MPLIQLSPHSIEFPPIDLALDDPNGLLALGGDLSPERLKNAYWNGIFPGLAPTIPFCGGRQIPERYSSLPSCTLAAL